MKNKNENSRRKFLDKGLKLGIITAIGGIGLTKLATKLTAQTESQSGEKMELMTTDGTMIEVDSSEVMEMDTSEKHEEYNLREGMPNQRI